MDDEPGAGRRFGVPDCPPLVAGGAQENDRCDDEGPASPAGHGETSGCWTRGSDAAGAAGLPFGVLRGYVGTDLPEHTSTIRSIECPFTGERLTAVPALNPDVAIIHAQRADRSGNVQIWGLVGVQKEAVLAATRSIVTVEQIVDTVDPMPNSIVLPSWVVSAVCAVPRGCISNSPPSNR